MTDWELVMRVFLSGIIGVFIVMIILQLSTMASSAVIGYFEKRGKDDEPKIVEKSNGGGN